jgi:hypothetical protein
MSKDDFDPRLIGLLDELKPIPERDPRSAARGKNKFLAEAVSLSEAQRHNCWTVIFQPGRKFARSLIASMIVVTGLLFGSGVTVAAAQSALPNDTLYPIKLWSEDTQLWLTKDPATRVDLLMHQVQTRTEEMAALNSQGVTPPAELTTRAQDRIEQALQIASTLEETQVPATLLQIRDRLQTQDHLLGQSQEKPCGDCEPILEQTRDMLQTHLGEVQNGLNDPQGFIQHRPSVPTPGPAEVPSTRVPAEIPTIVVTREAPEMQNPVSPSNGTHTPALNDTGPQSDSMETSLPSQGPTPQSSDSGPKLNGPSTPQSGPGGVPPSGQGPGPAGQPGGGGGPRP